MQPQTTPPAVRERAGSRWGRVLLLVLIGVLVLGGIAGGVFLVLRHPQDGRMGQWIAVPTTAPGQPTPTVPPGSFTFKDVGGNPIIYYPPANAPITITWQTYRDAQHGFHLQLPGNWTQLDQSPVLPGARMVCPPGSDTHADAPGAPSCVTYAWLSTYPVPSASDPTIADLHTITAGGVSGTLYTEAALGVSVTAVFPAGGGNVVITTFGNSDALMYAFQHMLGTLGFS